MSSITPNTSISPVESYGKIPAHEVPQHSLNFVQWPWTEYCREDLDGVLGAFRGDFSRCDRSVYIDTEQYLLTAETHPGYDVRSLLTTKSLGKRSLALYEEAACLIFIRDGSKWDGHTLGESHYFPGQGSQLGIPQSLEGIRPLSRLQLVKFEIVVAQAIKYI